MGVRDRNRARIQAADPVRAQAEDPPGRGLCVSTRRLVTHFKFLLLAKCRMQPTPPKVTAFRRIQPHPTLSTP
eukprot:gene27326-biopygen8703